MTDIIGRLNGVLHDAVEEIERLRKRVAELEEAGALLCNWHPTDINHPAHYNTQEYGLKQMARLLSLDESS